ncbi:cytochrome P450 [Antrihabitans sp. YC2-6]|uniref:cytochrome P450 n=1 Tax=Antrihabitans sp. YC2-6 TaxID=2799498 RepID=UPI0018F2E5A9|nr:cytochrome P450 [Antrihabitans sp. YC2-6]MBJ8345544.1 cytochrome P450 [Antrihabitans sp. YC2-6]
MTQALHDVNVLDVNLFDPAVLDDPYPTLDRLRRDAPVYRLPGTNFFVVSRWDLVAEGLTRTSDFSSNLTAVLIHDPVTGIGAFDMDRDREALHVLATADDPLHREHRKLVLPALVAKRIQALEPVVVECVRALWTERRSAESIEWIDAMASRLPLAVVARLIGLPDADVPRLVRWAYASTELVSGVVTTRLLPATLTAVVELAGYLNSAFSAALKHPGDDLLGDLARAHRADEVSAEAAVLILVQLVGAGGESTAGLMGNAASVIACDQALQARVRADRDLLGPVLEEVMRLESPFRGHLRHVVADTTLGGVPLPAGGHVVLLWGAANRDPAVFAEPAEFRLGRTNIRSHLGFGKGIHFCVGASLARLEARIALDVLLSETTRVDLTDAVWVPSLFVRRHSCLTLALT